jgi:ABC-type transport system involved in multi-copper enzyme maturation permease subunit
MKPLRAAMRRIWLAYTVEMVKAARLKFTYLGPVLVVLAVLGATLVYPVRADGVSDYDFIAKTTPLVLNLLGWLLVVVYCAGLVSSELGSGSIRLLAVRPVLRRELLAAKVLHGMTYALLLMVLVGGGSWLVAMTAGELRGIQIGGEVLFTGTDMALAYLLGAAVALGTQLAAVAYAIMVSTLTRSTGAAVGSALGVWILVDLVKYPLGVSAFLFTTYMETPWQVFAGRCGGLDEPWLPPAMYCVSASAVAAAAFVAVAVVALNRRNLTA